MINIALAQSIIGYILVFRRILKLRFDVLGGVFGGPMTFHRYPLQSAPVLYTVQCTKYTLHCTIQSTVYVQCTVNSVHWCNYIININVPCLRQIVFQWWGWGPINNKPLVAIISIYLAIYLSIYIFFIFLSIDLSARFFCLFFIFRNILYL